MNLQEIRKELNETKNALNKEFGSTSALYVKDLNLDRAIIGNTTIDYHNIDDLIAILTTLKEKM